MITKNNDINDISLIICAKNELQNLKEYLPLWLNQKSINYEVIIVDDHSDDGSYQWLTQQAKIFKQLIVISSDKQYQLKGKRNALLSGIEKAKYNHLAFSDADCFPSSDYHLRSMANKFKKDIQIVLGYSPTIQIENSLLIAHYENFITAIQYLSLAKIGFPYMGVGRNYAILKRLINKKHFFESNKTRGGDDDLFLSQLMNKRNTNINIDDKSFVYTNSPTTFNAWMRQKRRHYSTAKYYKLINILIAGGYQFFNTLFYVSILFCILKVSVIYGLILLIVKILAFYVFNRNNFKMLKKDFLLPNAIYLDFLFVLLSLVSHIYALKDKNDW